MIIKKVLVKIKYHLTELQEKLQNYIDWKLLNFKLNLKNDTWYMICPYGIGDIYLVCSLAEEFLLKHGGKKIVLLIKKNQFPIYLVKNTNSFSCQNELLIQQIMKFQFPILV